MNPISDWLKIWIVYVLFKKLNPDSVIVMQIINGTGK